MKIFISQPMYNKSTEEIFEQREKIINHIKTKYKNWKPVFIKSFDKQDRNKNPLFLLGQAISKLSEADIMVLSKGWQSARGCKIEYECCGKYDIPVLDLSEIVQ